MLRKTKMNACDVTDLDADALLPPRKRLLAGLKRQSSDVNFPIPSASRSAESEFDAHLNRLLSSQLSNPNTSNEEIVEASRRAATEAAKIAGIARANAEDKATKAAKAVAAAKSALDLVATISDEALKKEHRLKKNKLKKHIPVESLYSKNKGKTNCRADEELARNLHRSINSSPRISKSLLSSDAKTHKHKRLKNSASYEKTYIHRGGLVGEGNRPSIAKSIGNSIQEVSPEGPVKEIEKTRVDLNTSKSEKVGKPTLFYGEESHPGTTDRTKLEHGERKVLNSKDKVADSFDGLGKRRGRIKQKKLPLSICSFRDKTGPKDQQKLKDLPQSEDDSSGAAAGDHSSFPDSFIPVERTSVWKCQAFKTPACIKQHKVVHS